MRLLPKGKYVLFARFDTDDCIVCTYGILERMEYSLEASCDRDKLYRCISVGDDISMMRRTLHELNELKGAYLELLNGE